MSDVRDPDRDQQLPIANNLPSVHDLVCDLMQERKAHGTRKYGTPLQPANGRSFLLDAVEEAADLLAYLRGKLWEEDNPEQTWLGQLLWALIAGHPTEEVENVPPPVRDLVVMMQAAVDSEREA